MQTVASITAESVSRRSAQSTFRSPASVQVKSETTRLCWWRATSTKMKVASTAERIISPQVTIWAPRSPIQRPKKPAMKAPRSGPKTARTAMSALHQVDVFDRDGAAVAEVDDEDGEADRRLGGGDGEDEHGEDLADQVAEEGGEGDEVDVDGEQHQLDRHEDDDDVLAVEEDAEDPEREEDRGDGKIVSEPDRHFTHSAASASESPCPDATLRIAIAISGVRAF